MISILISLLQKYVFNRSLLEDDYDDRIPIELFRLNNFTSTTNRLMMMFEKLINHNNNNNINNRTIIISLIPMTYHFHLQITILVLIQILMAHILAMITYYLIIIPRKNRKKKHSNYDITSSSAIISEYIRGYGIIIPLSLLFPYYLFDLFNIRNRTLRFGCIIVPLTCILKCLYIMHSNTNDNNNKTYQLRTKSLRHFIYYMGFFFYPIYNNNDNEITSIIIHSNNTTSKDHNNNNNISNITTNENNVSSNHNNGKQNGHTNHDTTTKDDNCDNKNQNQQLQKQKQQEQEQQRNVKKPPLSYYINHLIQFYSWMIVIIIIYSILLPYNFLLFYDDRTIDVMMNDIYPTLSLKRMYNNAIVGTVLYGTLIMSINGIAITISTLTQCQFDTIHIFNHPLLYSSSPSDFWGRRWNRLIHTGLKEGIYQPIISSSNGNVKNSNMILQRKLIGKIMTFFVSGLLHEYVLFLIFYINSYERSLERDGICTTCYTVIFGKHIIFFGWNGIALLIEDIIRRKFYNNNKALYDNLMGYTICKILLGHIVVLFMAMPVSHLFTDDLLIGQYFHGLKHAIPFIIIETISNNQTII